MPNTTLVCITRDPNWSLASPIKKLHKISEIYSDRIVIASQDTAQMTTKALIESGWTVTEQTKEGVGEARRDALRIALKQNHKHIHLCDLDRTLHWINTYPDELTRIRDEIPHHDFLILGRTERALETHPKPQRLTESLTNQFFQHLMGQYMDMNAASRGISLNAVKTILNHSQAPNFETDVEWPIIIKHKSKLLISYIEVEGLEYETHLKYPKEVEATKGIEQWKRTVEQDPNEWLMRTIISKKMIEYSIQTIERVI